MHFQRGGGAEITVTVDPFIVVNTNVPDDFASPGDRFAELLASFSNQNFDDLTIDFNYKNGFEVSSGPGSFIIGSGNSFAVFSSQKQFNNETQDTTHSVTIFPGVIDGDIISSTHYTIIIVGGGGSFIPTETARSFKDEDAMSEVEIAGSFGVQNEAPGRSTFGRKLPHVMQKQE